MNILILSWRDPKHPLAGGAEQVMHEHAKAWIKQGHKITLFSAAFKDSPDLEILDGVKIIRKGNQVLIVHLRAFWWHLFSKEKFDLVIDQFHGIPFFTPLYVKTKRLAVLQEVAREVWLINHLKKPFNFFVGWLGYLTEPYIFWFYKRTIFMTASQSAKQDLIKMGIPNKNIVIVPHGVILKQPKKKVQRNKVFTVTFLGALARDKGIEDAIRSFALLDHQGNFNFWIIGKAAPEYLKALENLAKKLGVVSKLKFWGFVSQDKKFDLLSKSHVLINPSLREGWGLVNIEANSVGLPVIAYNSPGLVDSVKDGFSGFLVDKNTPEKLAEKVLKLHSNPKLYHKLSETSQKWSQKFTWEKSTLLSLKLIGSLSLANAHTDVIK